MKSFNASCPACNHQFPLDKLLNNEITQAVSAGTKQIIEEREKEIAELKTQINTIQETTMLKAKSSTEEAIKKALAAKEKELIQLNQIEIQHRDDELKSAKNKLAEAQKNELSLRQRMSEVDQKEKELDLELERKLSEKLNIEKQKVSQMFADDFHRKDLERERLISELRKQVIEMKQKAEQGSQQVHGEAFEEEISKLLQSTFPTDTFEDVPVGVNGADIIQVVTSKSGTRAGRIVWEVKQTKAFQPLWIEKLRDERNKLGAELAILVTETMPKDKQGAFLDQGIWIVDPKTAISVAKVARQGLIELHHSLVASNSRHEKADILYNYLTNPIFRQRLEAVVDSFQQMREDLDREKRAISKTWKQREKLIDSVVDNTLHIYSDIQGVVGKKVLNIQSLELPYETTEEDLL